MSLRMVSPSGFARRRIAQRSDAAASVVQYVTVVAEPVDLRIPFTTLLKVALTLLLCVCVIKLWPVILMIIVAILLAVMLDPLVVFVERHRVRRGVRRRSSSPSCCSASSSSFSPCSCRG